MTQTIDSPTTTCPDWCMNHYERPAHDEVLYDGRVLHHGLELAHPSEEFQSLVGGFKTSQYVVGDGELTANPQIVIVVPDIRHQNGEADDLYELTAIEARSYAAALLVAATELDRINTEVSA